MLIARITVKLNSLKDCGHTNSDNGKKEWILHQSCLMLIARITVKLNSIKDCGHTNSDNGKKNGYFIRAALC